MWKVPSHQALLAEATSGRKKCEGVIQCHGSNENGNSRSSNHGDKTGNELWSKLTVTSQNSKSDDQIGIPCGYVKSGIGNELSTKQVTSQDNNGYKGLNYKVNSDGIRSNYNISYVTKPSHEIAVDDNLKLQSHKTTQYDTVVYTTDTTRGNIHPNNILNIKQMPVNGNEFQDRPTAKSFLDTFIRFCLEKTECMSKSFDDDRPTKLSNQISTRSRIDKVQEKAETHVAGNPSVLQGGPIETHSQSSGLLDLRIHKNDSRCDQTIEPLNLSTGQFASQRYQKISSNSIIPLTGQDKVKRVQMHSNESPELTNACHYIPHHVQLDKSGLVHNQEIDYACTQIPSSFGSKEDHTSYCYEPQEDALNLVIPRSTDPVCGQSKASEYLMPFEVDNRHSNNVPHTVINNYYQPTFHLVQHSPSEMCERDLMVDSEESKISPKGSQKLMHLLLQPGVKDGSQQALNKKGVIRKETTSNGIKQPICLDPNDEPLYPDDSICTYISTSTCNINHSRKDIENQYWTDQFQLDNRFKAVTSEHEEDLSETPVLKKRSRVISPDSCRENCTSDYYLSIECNHEKPLDTGYSKEGHEGISVLDKPPPLIPINDIIL